MHTIVAPNEHTLVLNTDWTPISVLPHLSTTHWHAAIIGVVNGTLIPLHHYDCWTIHSPSLSVPVPSVVYTRACVPFHTRKVADRYGTAFLRDEYCCQYCGTVTTRPTADHVLPKSKKGTSSLTNITTACTKCNNRKGDDERIRPPKMPYVPTYYELVRKARRMPVVVPHASWIEYIGWPENLVKIKEPVNMPGYIQH